MHVDTLNIQVFNFLFKIYKMSFIGRKFPDIDVNAMTEMGDTIKVNVFKEAVEKNKKVVLFWYPKDFTFVCPTEIHAFELALSEFKSRNTIVIGASCDTPEVHFAWLNQPKKHGGIEGVTYPLIADSNRNLSRILNILDVTETYKHEKYGVEIWNGEAIPHRATYLIDEEGTVFYESINHMSVGRNINEYLRLIDAYSQYQEVGEVCPANWEEGGDTFKSSREGLNNYLKTA